MNVCDYGHETKESVYRLNTGGGGGVFLCEIHWKKEMEWRKERNKDLDNSAKFDILPFPK